MVGEDPLNWAVFWAPLLETIDVRRASRFDVALIEAIILSPDDEAWRAKIAISSFVEWVGDGAAEFSQEALVMLQRMTRAALPISEVHNEVKKARFERGVITGQVLRKLSASPHKTVREIAGEAMREVGCSLDPKTFHNEVRPVYRTVPHFWAAYIELAGCDPAFPFPCPAARLGEFLAAAEFFRLKGEAARIPGTKRMFLRKGEAFRLPPNLVVTPSIL
jgi:hypothetical protein